MNGINKTTTPDGLNVYHLDFVGMVVLAHEHNKAIAKLEKQRDEMIVFIKKWVKGNDLRTFEGRRKFESDASDLIAKAGKP